MLDAGRRMREIEEQYGGTVALFHYPPERPGRDNFVGTRAVCFVDRTTEDDYDYAYYIGTAKMGRREPGFSKPLGRTYAICRMECELEEARHGDALGQEDDEQQFEDMFDEEIQFFFDRGAIPDDQLPARLIALWGGLA